MPRLVYLLGVGIGLLGGGLALTCHLVTPRTPVTRVTWANILRIDPGMTRLEVEAILGRPSRDPPPQWAADLLMSTPSSRRNRLRAAFFKAWDSRLPPVTWHSEEGVIHLGFTEEGRVCLIRRGQGPGRESPLGPLDRLRAWLG